jgi:hypothetical protein
MLKSHNILFWGSGLSLGLMVCAFFSCPLRKVAVPSMLLLSVASFGCYWSKRVQENERARRLLKTGLFTLAMAFFEKMNLASGKYGY